MLRRILSRALILVACATPATAAPTAPFVVMGEPCAIDTVELDRWGGFGTNALIPERTIVPALTGALCAAKATLVSGQTTGGYWTLPSAQSTYTFGCRMYVPSLPTAEVRLADFYSNGSTAAGAILTLVPANGTYQLRASYRNEGTYTCNGSTADGTECTPLADETCSGTERDTTYCPENNHCESRCDKRTFATASHSPGEWITWTLQQENGTDAEVAVRLWSGTGGAVPTAYARGGGYQTVGFCAGGANALLACLTNSDCPASTCTTTRKVTIDRVRLGKWDTGTGTGTLYYAKCFGYAGSTAYPNLMWDTLQPNANPTPGNWVSFEGSGDVRTCSDTNLWDCLTDGSVPDGRLSAIENANLAKPTAYVNYSALATPTPMPTPLAVVLEAEVQQAASGTSTLDIEATTTGSSATSDYTDYLLDYADTGTSAGFYSAPTFLTTNSTVLSNAQSGMLQLQIARAGSGSNKMRITVAPVSVIRQTADPPIISTLPDRDRDGEQTVRFVGDSISANGDYQSTLNDLFAQLNVTNLDFCALGGTMPLDFADDWTAILNGGTSQFMSCNSVKRGTGGNVADVVTVMGGVNAWHGALAGPPSNLTTIEAGWAQEGLCETASGAGTGQGLACRCPSSTFQRRTNAAAGAERPCLTKGTGTSAFGYNGISGTACTCSSNADCVLNGKQGYCGRCYCNALDNGAYCTSGAGCSCGTCLTNQCGTATFAIGDGCKIANDYGGSTARPASWVGYGCDDAPGCSGWCLTTPPLTDVAGDIASLETETLAYPTPAATPPLGGRPIVVYLTEPSPQMNDGGVGCYPGIKHHVENLNLWLRQWTAAEPTRRFIDVAAYMDRNCPVRNKRCTDESCCYTDSVHPNARGQRTMAAIIYRAFANLDGTHDGTCTAGTCTTGKKGDACASNADCDYYRMDLTL